MKKTLQTAMTAAMFAAAATAMTAGISALPENSQVEALDLFARKTTTTTGTTMMTLYGPPPVDYTDDFGEEETTFTTTTMETDPFEDPWQSEAPVLYGPPSVFFESGDINMDKKLDARDLSTLKRMLLKEQEYWDRGMVDVNGDGIFDVEDIKAFRRKLTGKTKEQEEAEERERQGETTTTTMTTTTTFDGPTQTWPTTTLTTSTSFSGPTQTWPTTTASTVLTTMTMPLYGPPWVFTTTDAITTTTDVTEILPQPVYGPMPVEEIT